MQEAKDRLLDLLIVKFSAVLILVANSATCPPSGPASVVDSQQEFDNSDFTPPPFA